MKRNKIFCLPESKQGRMGLGKNGLILRAYKEKKLTGYLSDKNNQV